MQPEDPEQIDPELGLGTTESLHMSGYLSRFLIRKGNDAPEGYLDGQWSQIPSNRSAYLYH